MSNFTLLVPGVASLLSLTLLIHPWSLSPRTSHFSLSLDLDRSAGDQATSFLDVSPGQVVSIQIFGEDVQSAHNLYTLFEYDTTQVVYQKFDVGDVLPDPLVEQEHIFGPPPDNAFVLIDMTSLDDPATVPGGLIGTLRFRVTGGFTGTEIRLVRAGLGRDGRFRTISTALSVALENPGLPSLDFDGNGIVDFPDFLMFVGAFGSEDGQDEYDAKYDLNRDGKIAFGDFQIFTHGFGKIAARKKPPASPTPPGKRTLDGSPDLVVDSLSVSDSHPEGGASLTLRATVRNRGDGASLSL